MNCLLDSHSFLWFIDDNNLLSSEAKQLIQDSSNRVFVSAATLWELAIKLSINRLELPKPYGNFVTTQLAINDFDLLPITLEHADMVSRLPFHHRDPFDRMLIAQALIEQIAIISVDTVFDQYPVTRLW